METQDKPVVKIKLAPDFATPGILRGHVYGHPRFEDGTLVHTSLVIRREGSTVETLNTIYELISDDDDSRES